MKVKVGQLKTHLSSYLKAIQENGEPLEVCVREDPVALLSPIHRLPDNLGEDRKDWENRLRNAGLGVRSWSTPANRSPLPEPVNGLEESSNPVMAMRQERDW